MSRERKERERQGKRSRGVFTAREKESGYGKQETVFVTGERRRGRDKGKRDKRVIREKETRKWLQKERRKVFGGKKKRGWEVSTKREARE